MYNATVLKRNKTETRRTHGLSKVNDWPLRYFVSKSSINDKGFLEVVFEDAYRSNPDVSEAITLRSRFKVGEILYIAEPMYIMDNETVNNNLSLGKITVLDVPHLYKYDMNITQLSAARELVENKSWKVVSPMLMRQEYGRSFIRIREISIERLHDISRTSIFNEGVVDLSSFKPGEKIADDLLRIMYATLFDEINGVGSWDKNLFVFSYSYEFLPDFKRRDVNA